MNKYIFNFQDIKNVEDFYNLLEKILEDLFKKPMTNSWGRNLNSFEDLYSGPSEKKEFFEIRKYKEIKDQNFKNGMSIFINEVIPSLKEKNPNFDYKIID
jgi:RNAse (barnase) inhibitor barstar